MWLLRRGYLRLCPDSQNTFGCRLQDVSHTTPPDVLPELVLVREELSHRVLISKFRSALRSGGASGEPGSKLSLQEVTTEGLLQAIYAGMHLGLPSEETRRLYLTACILLRIREQALYNRWDQLAQLLVEASEAHQQGYLDDLASTEIQLYKEHAEHLLLRSQLLEAVSRVSTGSLSPS